MCRLHWLVAAPFYRIHRVYPVAQMHWFCQSWEQRKEEPVYPVAQTQWYLSKLRAKKRRTCLYIRQHRRLDIIKWGWCMSSCVVKKQSSTSQGVPLKSAKKEKKRHNCLSAQNKTLCIQHFASLSYGRFQDGKKQLSGVNRQIVIRSKFLG